MSEFAIQHDATAHVFSVDVDSHRGVVDYALRDGVMTMTHTGVPEAVRGRGVAAQLVRVALDTARTNGWKVIPACSYAAAFIRRHNEYADLLA
ncbi:MAG: GNAT family N-acetyltransferase [Rhodanobacteraceae bacterium]